MGLSTYLSFPHLKSGLQIYPPPKIWITCCMVDTSLDIGCIRGYKVCNGFFYFLFRCFFIYLFLSFFLSIYLFLSIFLSSHNQLQQKVVTEAVCHILLNNATSFLFSYTNRCRHHPLDSCIKHLFNTINRR